MSTPRVALSVLRRPVAGSCPSLAARPSSFARSFSLSLSLSPSPRPSLPRPAPSPSSLIRQLSSRRPLRFPAAPIVTSESAIPPSTSAPPPPKGSRSPPLSTPNVARWLYCTSFLTFSIVVVGGLTRLTESGLSITEWRPVKGSLPPLNQAQWEEEYQKYQESEEGRM